jgi:hypothetical protein
MTINDSLVNWKMAAGRSSDLGRNVRLLCDDAKAILDDIDSDDLVEHLTWSDFGNGYAVVGLRLGRCFRLSLINR